MNAAKRKRKPHPLAAWVAKCLPFLMGTRQRAIVGLTLAMLFLGGAVYSWWQWGGQITQSEEYFVLPEQIAVTALPKWIKTDVKSEVIRDGGLTRMSLLDQQLTFRVAQAFAAHPWVEKVVRVSKHQPPRLVVELVYRKPVAMVEVVFKGQPGLLPVDANGVLLQPTDFTEDQTHDYLRLSIPEATPAGAVGTAWSDPRVLGAARIAALLQDSWRTLGLHHIAANRPDSTIPAPKPLDAPTYDLYTRSGTRIIWGVAPSNDSATETTAALKKISRLLAYAKTNNGSLDTGKPSSEIDLRSKDEELRTAKRPLTPPRR